MQSLEKPEGIQKSVLAFLFGFIVAYKAIQPILVLAAFALGLALGHFVWR